VAAVALIDPELLDLGHTRPTVTSNGTYLDTVFIHHHERQPFAVISTRCTAVVLVKSIL
jgi:hypothetical protein